MTSAHRNGRASEAPQHAAHAVAAALRPPAAPRPPVLPLDVFDAPTQRLYASSLFVILQAYKLFHLGEATLAPYLPWLSTPTEEAAAGSRGLLLLYSFLDIALLFAIHRLRIPRLDWSLRTTLGLGVIMVALNYLLMGDWRVLGAIKTVVPPFVLSMFDTQVAITEVSIRLKSLLQPSQHILGRQTVHILPFATASLNPAKATFCLTANATGAVVALPLIFNNTRHPHTVRYSITDFRTGHRTPFTLSGRELASSSVRSASGDSEEEENELEDDWAEWTGQGKLKRRLEKSQKLFNLQIRRPGLVRLESALDEAKDDIAISRSAAVPVTQCPHTSFTSALPSRSSDDPAHLPPRLHRCVGSNERLELAVEGVAPLSLQYTRGPSSKANKADQVSLTSLGTSHTSTHGNTLESQALTHPDEYGWAAPERVVVPLEISLGSPGLYEYRLDSVRDSLGHTFHPSSPDLALRTFVAHEPARGRITGCSDEPLGLARNKTARFAVSVSGGSDQRWIAKVRFTPDRAAIPNGREWEREERTPGGKASITVIEPGTYELVGLRSDYCPGEVMLPSSCTVVWLPTPTLESTFSTIKDECAGEIGIRANLELTGAPPFTVHYAITPANGHREIKSSNIPGTRGELNVQPDRPGRFSLEILNIDDANYQRIAVADKMSMTAEVHPLASAHFAQHEQEVFSCHGDQVETQITMSGEPPFKVRYETVSGSQRKPLSFTGTTSPFTLSVPIPADVHKSGGTFEISLLDIEDGRQCQRPLKAKPLRVAVHRTPPTARFGGDSTARNATIKAGSRASLPLRLTGAAPWHVKYRLTTVDGQTQMVESRFNDANAVLAVGDEGSYELIEVRDGHCPGTVDGGASEYVVAVLPRPTLRLSGDAGKTESDSVVIRAPVCEGAFDSFDLQLEGTPPLELHYEHSQGGRKSKDKMLAVTNQANIVLSTNEPGLHQYRFSGISDAVYGEPHQGVLLSRSNARPDRLTLKQDVYARPTARFESSSQRTAFCVRDEFQPSKGRSTAELHLTGKAPFSISLDLREPNKQAPVPYQIRDIQSKTWSLALDHIFNFAGAYEVTLREVVDAHGCGRMYDAVTAPRTTIEVAEIATIASISPQDDYCVGQTLDFTLQGTQPWTVTYQWTTQEKKALGGRKVDERTVTTRDPHFSRLARSAGVFRVLSVAHEADQCRSVVEDIVKVVHPLPTARVGQGRETVYNIHEGERAEIIFQLEGTPPFSFTYERTAPQDRARTPQVLETHTINNVFEHSYSVYTSVEGTWSVTYVQDAFCAFPPIQPSDPQKRITAP